MKGLRRSNLEVWLSNLEGGQAPPRFSTKFNKDPGTYTIRFQDGSILKECQRKTRKEGPGEWYVFHGRQFSADELPRWGAVIEAEPLRPRTVKETPQNYRRRIILYMMDVDHHTEIEVGRQFGISRQRVHYLYHRAKQLNETPLSYPGAGIPWYKPNPKKVAR